MKSTSARALSTIILNQSRSSTTPLTKSQDFTVGFLYAIPTLLVLAVIAVGVILVLRVVIRRTRTSRKEKSENKDQPKN